jgi:hypothetical protein
MLLPQRRNKVISTPFANSFSGDVSTDDALTEINIPTQMLQTVNASSLRMWSQ